MFKILFYALAAVGLWYMIQSYQHGELKENVSGVVHGYTDMAEKISNKDGGSGFYNAIGSLKEKVTGN